MINETQIYQSKDLLDSLDLMHRLCKNKNKIKNKIKKIN